MKSNQARDFAIRVHNETGCRYDDGSYQVHLEAVVAEFHKYAHLLPEHLRDDVEAACWLHDVEEDCRVTHNDLVKRFGLRIADWVYNVTNELGKNRKERAEKTYPKIATCEFSTFIKLCDRLANTKHNSTKGGTLMGMYRTEYTHFRAVLKKTGMFEQMWAELDALYGWQVS